MLYLLYIFVGLLIIFGVNLMITGLLAVHDMYTRRDDEEPTFDTFKSILPKIIIFRQKCQTYSIRLIS